MYNVSYILSQVRNIFPSMGMACIEPRPQHRKANKKAQEEFKTNFSIGVHYLALKRKRRFMGLQIVTQPHVEPQS